MDMLPPDSCIGVLGGGQLGRMLALEARRMGYRLVTWTGVDEIGPAALADRVIARPFDDPDAFYARHGANLRGPKRWLFVHAVRRWMNDNVARVRAGRW